MRLAVPMCSSAIRAVVAALLCGAGGAACSITHATRRSDAAVAPDADVVVLDGTADGMDGAPDALDAGDAAPEAGPDVFDAPPEIGPDVVDVVDVVDVPVVPDVPATCVSPMVSNYCTDTRPMSLPPVIDGMLDCGLRLQGMPRGNWIGVGMDVPMDNSAQFATAIRDDGLYVFVSVMDAHLDVPAPGQGIYCGDGVEVYVDNDAMYSSSPMYDEPGTRQFIFAFARADGAASQTVTLRNLAPASGTVPASRYRLITTPTGYAFELFVTAADLGLATWMPPAGHIGFDLAINVGFTGGAPSSCNRLGQYFLRVESGGGDPMSHAPYNTVRAFCNVATH